MPATYTTNYRFVLNEIGAAANIWGNEGGETAVPPTPVGLNANFKLVDTNLKAVSDVANAALPKAGGEVSGTVTFTDGTGKLGSAALPAEELHAQSLSIHQPATGAVASISAAGLVTGLDFVATSDVRLKDEIERVEPRKALNMVRALAPVSFKWKQSGEPALGLIAQDVRNVQPLAVVENKGTSMLAISQPALVALLIGAVKGLSEEVAQLRGQLALL